MATVEAAAEKFTNLYYEYVDKMRHKLGKLYHPEGVLVWNGNESIGAEKIQKFFEDLPVSDHKIVSLDCQSVGSSSLG
ncbi:NTF2-related export protein 2 [Armadillidium vulgare]|nr:NTF2-related export protein 2 [Armadillidium vulgare]